MAFVSIIAASMKKVLILTASFGRGHMSVAEHVKTALDSRQGGFEAKIIDYGEYASGPFAHSQRSYDATTKYMPKAWQMFFDITNDEKALIGLCNLGMKMSKKRTIELLKREHPDMIVITFAGWVYAASKIAKSFDPNIKVVSLATDSITIHLSWMLGDLDAFIVPDKDTAEIVIEDGMNPELVKAIGYPVNPKLYDKKFDGAAFLGKQGLDPHRKSILLIPTLLNKDKTVELIEQIAGLNRYNLAVICGRDKELYRKLNRSEVAGIVKLVGWTNKMPEYMLASDIIITKAGGSTTQECIAAQKPVIINQIVPGQEQGNALYVEKNHLGLVALSNADIVRAIEKVDKHYKTYQSNLKKVFQPDAAGKVADYLTTLLEDHN